MGRYVIGRLLWVVPRRLVVTLIPFTIFVMPPGSPRSVCRQAADAGADCPGRAATRAGQAPLLGVAAVGVAVRRLPRPPVHGDTADVTHPRPSKDVDGRVSAISYDGRTAIRQEIIERAPKTLSLALGPPSSG